MKITLTQAHEAILAQLRIKFPKVTVDSYDPVEPLSVLAPALLLEIEELTQIGDDVGDDRIPGDFRFSIHCVLGREVKGLDLEVREFAIAVVMFVRQHGIWIKGGVLTKPKQLSAYPGNFNKETNKGYDSWVVSWEQTLYLGESIWTSDGITPQQVSFGYAPNGEVSLQSEHEEIKNE